MLEQTLESAASSYAFFCEGPVPKLLGGSKRAFYLLQGRKEKRKQQNMTKIQEISQKVSLFSNTISDIGKEGL